MKIIGLSGQARVGKSTAAAIIGDRGYVEMTFAGPLKDMIRAYYRAHGLSAAEIERRIEGDLKELPDAFLGGKSPRYAMQTLGTEWGRVCMGQSFWVDSLTQRAGDVEAVVVPDCRFPDEVETIHGMGGVVVRITRGATASINGVVGHVSEQDDFAVDATISNDNSKSYLHAALKETLMPLGLWNRSTRSTWSRVRSWCWFVAGVVSGVFLPYN